MRTGATLGAVIGIAVILTLRPTGWDSLVLELVGIALVLSGAALGTWATR